MALSISIANAEETSFGEGRMITDLLLEIRRAVQNALRHGTKEDYQVGLLHIEKLLGGLFKHKEDPHHYKEEKEIGDDSTNGPIK